MKSNVSAISPEAGSRDVKLWLRLLSCVNIIETELRQRMREQFGSTLPRFDMLAQLDRFPDGIKMGELSRLMLVTGGNITGLADSLEKEGMAVRVYDPNDRRSCRIKLTASGKQQFDLMAAAHQGWLNELMAALPVKEKDQLYTLLGNFKSQFPGM
ncbi:MarR family transcriptional regulator [Klebsiella sp. RHBSTW-00215]|uniref:MarR family winged helix-turn-helix transcriptional regulator n=1 Tax=Klebsiella sp. RHBSTW-00215 TaxID=2742640 RepID=UPI0015F4539F|nr:MarR family transcriptional regulator [Klebsiella sp. RHBSTW-00215]MBA7931632.1 MarR family transcriptional regulator [Klebsiella sp. RHBSTW-00215]